MGHIHHLKYESLSSIDPHLKHTLWMRPERTSPPAIPSGPIMYLPERGWCRGPLNCGHLSGRMHSAVQYGQNKE